MERKSLLNPIEEASRKYG